MNQCSRMQPAEQPVRDRPESNCSAAGSPRPCLSSEPLNGADASCAGASDKRTLSKIFWAIVPIHWGIILWTYFDRSSLSFAAISLIADLHLTNFQYGLGAGSSLLTRYSNSVWRRALLVFSLQRF